MARLATAVNQYQTNNNGKVPSASSLDASTLSGTSMPTCGTGNGDACKLVVTYLNSVNASENEFIDPDGNAYGIIIKSDLTGESAPTTLNHNAYLYTKAECDGEWVKATSNPRDYAIVYKMEGSGTYCKDSR